MLIKVKDLKAIAQGEISLVFRRWKRPTVKAGGTLRTTVGVLAIDAIDEVTENQISAADARRAGYSSRQELLAELAKHHAGRVYRIEVKFSGADPRQRLRGQADLTEEEVAEISGRLARFDKASPPGPWTRDVLRLISERPATRAGDLAAAAGFETRWLKAKVRRLKELGLTESLGTGYRLSPRGSAFVSFSSACSRQNEAAD